MTILKTWVRQSEKRKDVLEITEGKVYINCYEGEDCSAVGCTWAEFGAGKLNGVVVDVFGASVLRQALTFIQQQD